MEAQQSTLIQKIEGILEEPLLARGYVIVRIRVGGSIRRTLQIMIERQDDVPITVDDCATVSRLSSTLLDVSDPLKEAYILEVSSAGLDRPLVKLKDFEKYCGHKVIIRTYAMIEGQKKFQGILVSASSDSVIISLDIDQAEGAGKKKIAKKEVVVENAKESPRDISRHVSIPFQAIKSANLHVDWS